VLRLREDTRMDFIELDRLLRTDQNIASVILKMANSTFYSRGQEIRTLPQAIGMIGFRTIVSIVSAASAKSMFSSGNYARFRRYVWQHSPPLDPAQNPAVPTWSPTLVVAAAQDVLGDASQICAGLNILLQENTPHVPSPHTALARCGRLKV
jgi:hypothetical protein